MNRAIGWPALLVLGRRSEISVATVLALLFATLAFAAVAGPRYLIEAESESLDLAIAQAPTSARQLSIRLIDDFGRGFDDDPLAIQRTALDDIAQQIEPVVLDRYGPARLIADTSRFSVIGLDVQEVREPGVDPPAPALPTFLTFRVHPELDSYSSLVAGRAAAPTDLVIDGAEVIEFELSAASAAELGWELDDAVLFTTDPTDLVTRQFNAGLPDRFVGQLVGLRELAPADDSYWFGDARLHRPSVADTGTGANVFAFAAIAPEQLPTRPFMVGQRSPFLLEQRRDLPAGSIALDNVDDTLDGLRSLEASFGQQPTLSRPGVVATLGSVLDTEQEQRRVARTTVVVAAVGVLGVVLTALGQLLSATFARRRASVTVARARGASRPQLVVATAFEVGVIAVLALIVGAGAAGLVFGGSTTSLETSLLLGLWVGATGTATLLAVAEGLRPVAVSVRDERPPGLGRWGRVGGWLLLVVAVAAVVTFRRRGVAIDAPDVDPLVVLLPVVVPLAIVQVLRRLLPLAVRQVADRGLSLGLGRLVGLRRAVDRPEATVGIVTVLVLALTVGALGLGVDRALDQGAVDASWTEVGAPYRLDTRETEVARQIREIPGAVVSASGSTRVNLDRDDTTVNVRLRTIDVPELQTITAGTAADARYPASLTVADDDGRIPAVAARRMGGLRIRVGDELSGLGTRSGQVFVVVETRAEMSGLRTDWLIADRSVVDVVTDLAPAFDSLAIDVPEAGAERLRSIAATADETLDVRTEVLDLQRDDPLSRAVRRCYLVAALLAAVLAVLTLVAVVVVTARDRRRELSVLGLLGADRRELGRAVASELLPATVSGAVAGVIVGWAIVRLYDDRFDLSAFAGGSPVSIRGDAVALIVLAAMLVLVAIVLVTLLVRRVVRARSAELMRIDGAA